MLYHGWGISPFRPLWYFLILFRTLVTYSVACSDLTFLFLSFLLSCGGPLQTWKWNKGFKYHFWWIKYVLYGEVNKWSFSHPFSDGWLIWSFYQDSIWRQPCQQKMFSWEFNLPDWKPLRIGWYSYMPQWVNNHKLTVYDSFSFWARHQYQKIFLLHII